MRETTAEFRQKSGAFCSADFRGQLPKVPPYGVWEPHFRPQERMEDLEVERYTMAFLFTDADTCTFMNPDNFEQVEIPRTVVGPSAQLLQPGMKLPVEFFEGQPISVVFPDSIEARIVDTAPPVHAQQDSTWKEAVLDNGLQILVPLFIAPGELVRVDVRTNHFLERVRSERKRSAWIASVTHRSSIAGAAASPL